MADFMQAVKWMKEGMKVRRDRWDERLHIDYEDSSDPFKFVNGVEGATLLLMGNFEGTDWEIYRDETSTKFLKRAGTDGTLWAKEFMKLFGDEKDKIDEGLMIGWFCNAIEAGKSAT